MRKSLFLISFCLLSLAPAEAQASTIIYYDHTGANRDGILLANMLINLAGHFDPDIQPANITDYQSGEMDNFDRIFYLGYESPILPRPFLADVASGEHRILWISGNLEQLDAFLGPQDPFGFRFVRWLHGRNCSRISYQGRELSRVEDLSFFQVKITGAPQVYSYLHPPDDPEEKYPHFLCGGNLCYLAEIPFWQLLQDDRYFVFADLLHEFYQLQLPEQKLALVRIEDLAPGVCAIPPLMEVTDWFAAQGIPFSFGVIPIFKDPEGIYFPPGTEIHFAQDPELVAGLNYLLGQGGTMLEHGVTHQHDNGISREDWEFVEGLNNQPLPYDSETWVRGRVTQGIAEFATQGWSPEIWETPHYAASHGDYRVIAEYFPTVYERPLAFPVLPTEPPVFQTNLFPLSQELPYFTAAGALGSAIVPENLGEPDPQVPGQSPEDLLAMADRLSIVRDGVASFFFHYDQVAAADLQTVIEGLLDRGYAFVGPGYFIDEPPLDDDTVDDETVDDDTADDDTADDDTADDDADDDAINDDTEDDDLSDDDLGDDEADGDDERADDDSPATDHADQQDRSGCGC